LAIQKKKERRGIGPKRKVARISPHRQGKKKKKAGSSYGFLEEECAEEKKIRREGERRPRRISLKRKLRGALVLAVAISCPEGKDHRDGVRRKTCGAGRIRIEGRFGTSFTKSHQRRISTTAPLGGGKLRKNKRCKNGSTLPISLEERIRKLPLNDRIICSEADFKRAKGEGYAEQPRPGGVSERKKKKRRGYVYFRREPREGDG